MRTVLFAAGGALVGLGYYAWIGCSGGCIIASSPLRSMLYFAVVGGLVSIITKGGCDRGCNT